MIATRDGGSRAPDGSPVAVFATFPAGNGPAYIGACLRPGSTVLDLGCGAGRISLPLAAAGHHVTGIDVSVDMIAALGGAASASGCSSRVHGVVADIGGLALGRSFNAVILASYLVNDPDQDRAHRFLQACRRHVTAEGKVFIQRHHPDFLATTEPLESAQDGYGFRYEPVAREGTKVRARMTYLHDDHEWHQEFDTMILDDDAFVATLDRAALRLGRWLDEFATWAEVTPA